jgi:hypothetical protein
MNRILLKSVFFIALFLHIGSLFAQDWKEYQEIYKDGGITVKLKFKENFSSCFTGAAKKSKMTFLVEGVLKTSPQYVNFKLDFFDCDEKFQQKEYALDIGPTGALGEVESSDYLFFAANVARRPYEIKASGTKGYGVPAAATSYPSNTGTTYPSNPSTTYPSSGTTYPSSGSTTSSGTYTYKKPKPRLMHFGWGFGIDMHTRPMTANQTTQADPIGTPTQVNPMGVGLRTDFMFHPIFHKNVLFGINTGAAVGTTLLFANKNFKYLYYSWEFGGELGVGVKKFKVIGRYNNSFQYNKYTRTKDNTTTTARMTIRREYIAGGFRFLSSVKKRNSNRSLYIDFTVDGSRDFAWSWSSPKWQTSGAPWQLGMGLHFWTANSMKIGADVSFGKIENGKYSTLKANQVYSQIVWVYNLDRFF